MLARHPRHPGLFHARSTLLWAMSEEAKSKASGSQADGEPRVELVRFGS
jgi:hypothetical protein